MTTSQAPAVPVDDLPRLSRRSALLGAVALLAPLGPTVAFARARPTPPPPGTILLNGNENPYGPSPSARQAIIAGLDRAPRYADATIEALANQVGAREGVPAAQVMVGSGSGELLRMAGLLASTTAPGSELVASQPTYEELPVFAGQLGLQVKWVAPDAAHRHDLAAMRAAITDRTSLVYVCNPNNPTGTAVTRDALEAFIRSVPASTTVVVDEAYIDFLEGAGYGSVAGLVLKVPNLIVLRTFSKIHGLAGLRVGYSTASVELAKRFADLSLVWPNNSGLDAALASYNDAGFLQSTRAAILADRARVHAAIDKLGLPRTEAQGNFVFFDTRVPLQGYRDRMLAQGIKVGRPFAGYPTWSRVSIGRREEIDRFL
ncbi:MAG: aminotransferase class I/II-fold pyridoxal phosphate-dependent enzyme, partial [Gammaproteobacteria bacterium]|nr:aminotransferase class I/II-fold pyridoxal phosphate-dependent enzyme [Gammaproteobacteria bacterium]